MIKVGKYVYGILNLLVPFIVGYLLNAVAPVTNWRFWVIMTLVILFRGVRRVYE